MSLCPILKADQIDLKQAAGALGKSPRQVRRYVQSGHLRAGGGGHGVPYTFAAQDVERLRQRIAGKPLSDKRRAAYRPRAAWQGVIDADGLARIAYALQLSRQAKAEDRACKWLPWWESKMLWKWAETGIHSAATDQQRSLWRKQLNGALRTAFPPLSDVPQQVLTWAQNTARQLTPAEVDYIAAMFVVVAHPWSEFTQAETAAFGQVLSVSGRGGERVPLSPDEIGRIAAQFKPGAWRAFTAEQKQRAIAALSQPTVDIDELLLAYESGDTVALRALIEDRMDNAGVFQRAPYAHLRVKSKDGEGEDETEDSAPDSLIDSSWKYAKDRKRETQGKPSGAKVARLLGIHRYQGTRLWRGADGRDGIAQKLGPRQWDLFSLLGMETRGQLPRLLKKYAPAAPQKKTEDKPSRVATIDLPAAAETAAAALGISPADIPAAARQTEGGLRRWLEQGLADNQDLQRKASAGKGKGSVASEDDQEMHGGPGYVPTWKK